MQADDKRLLELAAKAAGHRLTWKTGYCKGGEFCGAFIDENSWSPLSDDGDAMRLAVALRLTIYHDELAVIIKHKRYSWEWMGEMVDEGDSGDRNSATRRAIVRAAAAIGEAMP